MIGIDFFFKCSKRLGKGSVHGFMVWEQIYKRDSTLSPQGLDDWQKSFSQNRKVEEGKEVGKNNLPKGTQQDICKYIHVKKKITTNNSCLSLRKAARLKG